MTYKILENTKGYLTVIADGITEEHLHIYGEIIDEMWDNYKDCNPKHAGYVLKRGMKKLYAKKEEKL